MGTSNNVIAMRQPSFSGKLRKPRNDEVRSREHLTPSEIASPVKAAKETGRHGHRDATLILIAYRHGLRVSELVALRWDQVDLEQGVLHVHRLKGGTASTHPLRGPELRTLRRLRREYPDTPYLFVSERGGPVTDHTVRKLVKRAGQNAGIDFPIHPHMLRHACGYKLANDGHDTRSLQHYLGHKNIQHTVRYTELAVDRFKKFWNIGWKSVTFKQVGARVHSSIVAQRQLSWQRLGNDYDDRWNPCVVRPR